MKYLIRFFIWLGLADYLAHQLSRPNGFLGSRFIGAMMNRGNKHLEMTALDCANLKPTDLVLEIGFGNGKMLERLCATVTRGRVIGADVSEDLVKQVSKRLTKQIKTNRLEIHLAGVTELPLEDNSVDCILTCNTIYFWPEPLEDAKELLRVLRPSGRLICGYRTAEEMKNFEFVNRNLDIFLNRYSDNEVKQLFLDAGFTDCSITVEASELAPSHIAIATK